jgi:hypothetical protein
VLAYSFIK